MKAVKLIALFVCVWVAGASRWAMADGVVRDGVGAISSGRGGTNLGFADNGAILLDNPGAMVNVANNGLIEADVDTVISELHYTDPKPNNVHAKILPVPLPELAFIKKSADGDWAWGLGAFAPAGFGASYNFQNSFAGPQNYRSIGALGKILPGLSYRVNDRLSIGGTFGLAFGHVDLEGPFFMQTGALRGAPAIIDLQGTNVAPTGSVGAQYKLSPKTTLGICFTTESRFHQNGDMKANVFGVGPFPIYSQFAARTDLIWPRSLSFGVKHDLSRRHQVAADVFWYDWKHAFNHVDLALSNPSNPMVAALVGPTNFQSIPLNWHDTVSLRLGYQFMPSSFSTWRAGYVYHTSPTPNNTLTPLTDGILTHAFSLGHSRRINRAWLNVSYQYSFSPTRHVGTSILAGGDFSNSTLNAQAHWVNLGVLVPF
ncbi:MAG TPA: outer membrane protein transport protein [Pirellulales bacterium]|nr:outer membrane protein transport protein [Pirellulales bacterium]